MATREALDTDTGSPHMIHVDGCCYARSATVESLSGHLLFQCLLGLLTRLRQCLDNTSFGEIRIRCHGMHSLILLELVHDGEGNEPAIGRT